MKLILAIFLFAPLLSFASDVPIKLESCDDEFKNKIEKYLSGISKTAIMFEQISSDNISQRGILLIEKPLKFRVNYDSPHPLVIAGGKNFVSLYDYELDELSRIDANDNLFKFLLELNVSIEKSVKILTCTNYDDNIELSLLHKETEQKAKINFSKEPLRIFSLIIPEDGNNFEKGKIEILFDKVYDIKFFPVDLFILKDPKIYGPAKRYSSENILNLLGYK